MSPIVRSGACSSRPRHCRGRARSLPGDGRSRPRRAETWIVQVLCAEGAGWKAGFEYETSRARFVGRGRTTHGSGRHARTSQRHHGDGAGSSAGATTGLRLEAGAHARVTLTTALAASRDEGLDLVARCTRCPTASARLRARMGGRSRGAEAHRDLGARSRIGSSASSRRSSFRRPRSARDARSRRPSRSWSQRPVGARPHQRSAHRARAHRRPGVRRAVPRGAAGAGVLAPQRGDGGRRGPERGAAGIHAASARGVDVARSSRVPRRHTWTSGVASSSVARAT